jgi:isoprenylcysteine carboxyl methyltransferase (ICMT) family protein YpbQ
MAAKTPLKILFAAILVTMIVCTGYATSQQSVLQWGGLTTGPDRYWTIATLFDAYFGFLTFYVWVLYKERGWLSKVLWFIAIMALGNMAMASYVLWQLARLRPDQPASAILAARNG